MTKQQPPIVIRAMVPGDLPLVLDSWVRTSRSADPWAPTQTHDVAMGRHLERLTACASVWAAANREDADRVLGWICAEPSRGLLHWVWVREPWRRAGIASALVGAVARECQGPLMFTGWSHLGVELARSLQGLKPWPDCYRPDLGR
jgi:GNAT superfamily N-acetyltransferase